MVSFINIKAVYNITPSGFLGNVGSELVDIIFGLSCSLGWFFSAQELQDHLVCGLGKNPGLDPLQPLHQPILSHSPSQ